MAARSDDPDVSLESAAAAAAAGGEIWGTLEELLLACAVSRHGTASWDSVAMEVQSRSPSAAARLTPASCRLRFRLLHRRFAAGADEDGDGEEPDAPADADSWVEELRKLRVAELRREVERYDLSIGSLQSKVKRLKEERERSLSGEGPPAVKKEQDAGEGSPEEADGEDRVSGGEESGRSCKESNSSDLKRPVHDDAGAADDDHGDAAVKEEPVAACQLTMKEEASGESVAGSKEADAGKESSDVQSSASPSRRRRRRLRKVAGDEAVSTSTSAPVSLPAVESEPLLAFLESVRTSKSGSVFERRLESQEGGRYRGTIRRHVDLETIRSKLESGATTTTTGQQGTASCRYASASEFYRDLLLLCANALVYFPRRSPEYAAAARTRAVVSKHISSSLRKDGLGNTGKAAAVVGGSSAEGTKKPKADAEIAGSLLEKATPIIVCRKRSSIAKAAAAAAKEEKVENAEAEEEEENEDKKKGGAKDNARGLRTNKSRGPLRNAAPNQKTGKASESGAAAADATKKSDKKGVGGSGSGSGSGVGKGAAGGVIKKRNAVDFLNRMKQNSVPSTERVSLLETLKLSAATEQKKSGKGGDSRKEPGGSGSKKATATDPPSGGRRSVGRPPKRAAAPPTPPPSKRAKDDRPTRKRGKK